MQETLRCARPLASIESEEWFTDDRKNSPEFGIPQLARYMRDGKFSVPAATHQDRQYGKELERALVRYPNKPNDLPMALWLAQGMMRLVWDSYADLSPVYMPGRDSRVPQYMLDSPTRVDLSLIEYEAV